MTNWPVQSGSYRIIHLRERAVVVELLGEHDLSTAEKLGRIFESLAAANDIVIVDVRQTEFIDSTVLKELVRAERIIRDCGGRFVLSQDSNSIVTRLLEVSGMADHFEVADGWDFALDRSR